MSDAYAYWREALEGKFGPVHTDDPRPGFYRMKVVSEKTWTPVAIWPGEDGQLVALKHHFVIEQPLICDAAEAWNYCCSDPVTEAAYRAVAEQKLPWPDAIYRRAKA
jgi:hypothetical protein